MEQSANKKNANWLTFESQMRYTIRVVKNTEKEQNF